MAMRKTLWHSALLLFALTPGLAQTNLFLTPPQSVTTGGPAAAVGDFNNDGKLDIAIVANTPTVNILLGNGDGTFKPEIDTTIPAFPTTAVLGALTAADVNGDGNLDVIVVTTTGVSVLLGNGGGTLQAPVDYATPLMPIAVTVADFNGDGKPDLAVTNSIYGDYLVSVFLNSGTGTFSTRKDATVSILAAFIVSADFNGDGKMDLATANVENPGAISVLLGNGDGTFQSSVQYTVGINPGWITAADLNGDGITDLAVVNVGVSGPPMPVPSSISVLLGNGDGTFQSQQVYATTGAFLMAADFNGDGQIDLATDEYGVGVYLNQGHGVLAQPTILFGTGSLYIAAGVTGDFNSDGKPDVAVIGSVPPANVVTVLLGDGTGEFSQSPKFYPTGNSPNSVAVSDVNGDGKLDMVVANNSDNTVSVLLGNGDGSLQPQAVYPTGTAPLWVAIGDLNGDGKPDLIAVCGNAVSILLGNGDGTFQVHTDYAVDLPIAVVLGDFNKDGKLDFAVLSEFGPIIVYLNNGNETFNESEYPLPLTRDQSYAALGDADVNSDGNLDLLAVGGPGSIFGSPALQVLLGNGDGTFQAASSQGGGNAQSLAIADFDGDGLLDVAEGGYTLGVELGVELGNGNGTFGPEVSYAVSGNLAVGDFNGDGKPDLAVTNGLSPGAAGVLLNTAIPNFTVSVPSTPTTNPVLSPGASASATVTLATFGGFSGMVALSCTVAPVVAHAPTCSFNPPQVTVSIGVLSYSTVTINTTAPTMAAAQPSLRPSTAAYLVLWIPVLGLAFAGAGFRSRRGGRTISSAVVLGFIICAGIVLQSGCGGGSSSSTSIPTSTPGTYPAVYSITVIGRSGALQHSSVTQLTVQQ
jgi:hypothetical protein